MTDNMLIDGLIKFCDEKSKNIKLKAEPQVFIEIREALLQLKVLKSDGFTDDLLNIGYTKGYNKAIDEFAERLKKLYQAYDIDLCLQDNDHLSYTDSRIALESYIDEIAEQMKGGAE